MANSVALAVHQLARLRRAILGGGDADVPAEVPRATGADGDGAGRHMGRSSARTAAGRALQCGHRSDG